MDIAKALREHQEQDLELGSFWKAIHEFTLRTLFEFFGNDMDEMGYPCFGVGHLSNGRFAEFTPVNGLLLPNVITFDITKVETAAALQEYIAHELVHQWLYMLEYDQSGNAHDDPFIEKMMDYGIVTKQGDGEHLNLVGDIWEDWLAENEDLKLWRFRLGEMDDGSDDKGKARGREVDIQDL